MSCGCTKPKCGCSSCAPVVPTCPCAEVCTALVVTNSWNIPSCAGSAILSVPGLTTVLIGSYIYNPSYGWFRITAFDSVNGQLTVYNECITGTLAPGTVVPALTTFIFTAPPSTTNVTYSGLSAGTAYNLTGSSAPLVFGTTQASITLTLPGTYLIQAALTFYANGLTIPNSMTLLASLKRQNNTPGDLVASIGMVGVRAPLVSPFTEIIGTHSLYPVIYTTLNTTDIININSYYSGGVPSTGNFQVTSAAIVAVKLS